MSWYRLSKNVLALRKNVLRVDLHIHAGDAADFTDEQVKNSTIKSILSAAIIKGLDVVGIISHDGPEMGLLAIQIAKNEGIDLWVVAGQEYTTTDKIKLIAYNLTKAMPPNMDFQTASEYVHKNKGLVMAIDITRRQAQLMNRLKGTPSAPDAIELYNAAVGWFMDIDIDTEYANFTNSAAKNAKMLEDTNVYTLINRKQFEQLGFLPPGAGTDYVPKYLKIEDKKTDQAANLNNSQPGVAGNV